MAKDGQIIVDGKKRCSVCRGIFPITEFHRDKSTSTGLASCCKACSRDAQVAYLAVNPISMEVSRERRARRDPEKVKAHQQRATLKARYGVTPEWLAATFEAQGGVCAACKLPETKTFRGRLRMLAIDHNHKTGDVRRLLCSACNTTLGLLGEDIGRIETAVLYLESHAKITSSAAPDGASHEPRNGLGVKRQVLIRPLNLIDSSGGALHDAVHVLPATLNSSAFWVVAWFPPLYRESRWASCFC